MSSRIVYDRAAMRRKLASFAGGDLDLGELRRWFTPLLADNGGEAPEHDHDVVFRLVYLFEDESLDKGTHRTNAHRLAQALHEVEDNAALLELVPIITDQDRLCGILEKYRAGLVTRTGFLSFVSETRYSTKVKSWLAHTDLLTLLSLCNSLSSGKYSAAAKTARLS